MKKIIAIFTTVLALTACVSTSVSDEKINVVASFYPLYEIAYRVGGDFVNVKNLLTPGAEPHDYEPTPQDIIALHQAKLILYNGAGLEPWADKIVSELTQEGIVVINESENVPNLMQGVKYEGATGLDPHIWLDPLHYIDEILAVKNALTTIDPAHASEYEANATRFLAQIREVDGAYKNGLNQCKFHSFITNHAAFGYLANRYNLEMIPIAGISPDAEPSPQDIARLADTIQKLGVKYILTESLVSSKIADVLADEVGAKTLVLNPLEGLTSDDLKKGKNYITVMKDNLTNLRTALECK